MVHEHNVPFGSATNNQIFVSVGLDTRSACLRRVRACIVSKPMNANERRKDIVQHVRPYFPNVVYLVPRSDVRVHERVGVVVGRVWMRAETRRVVLDVGADNKV